MTQVIMALLALSVATGCVMFTGVTFTCVWWMLGYRFARLGRERTYPRRAWGPWVAFIVGAYAVPSFVGVAFTTPHFLIGTLGALCSYVLCARGAYSIGVRRGYRSLLMAEQRVGALYQYR